MKNDCAKFKKWLENKGNSISCVCYESNMVDVNHNTWWIDSISTIHILNTLHDMRNLRKPIYSASVVNSETHFCSFDYHDIAPLANVNKYP